MKLNYKILWIDDQIEDYIEIGIKDDLESHLVSLGFIPTIDCFENSSDAKESIENTKYDLILSDFNIEGTDEQGDQLIGRIRDGGIFTEVLFYSGQPNFEEIAKELYRDRVSFFSLIGDEGYKGFKEKTINLINHTISKLQELNSIRGLVMSETSELDNTVEDIILTFLQKENENSEVLKNYICKSILDSTKSRLKQAEKLCELEIPDLVKSRLFDADKKSRTINKLIQVLKLTDEKYKDFYDAYKKDVLDVRNDLAHAKSDTIEGVEYLLVSRKDGEHTQQFNQEQCIEIRKNLMKHADVLEDLKKAI